MTRASMASSFKHAVRKSVTWRAMGPAGADLASSKSPAICWRVRSSISVRALTRSLPGGISVAASQAPFAKAKKSSPGRTLASTPASGASAGCGLAAEAPVGAMKAAKTETSRTGVSLSMVES